MSPSPLVNVLRRRTWRTACLSLADPPLKFFELDAERRDTKEDWEPEDANEAREVREALPPKGIEKFDSEEEDDNDAETPS